MKLWNEPNKEDKLYGLSKYQKTLRYSFMTLAIVLVWTWFFYELWGFF